jgi:hypothetical protein
MEHFQLRERMTLTTKTYCSRLYLHNIKYFFRWPLVNFNMNELFCLKYSVLMDLINTLFFINQRFLRF